MISINTNLSSFIIQSSLKTSTNGLNQAIERMTTGFKLNHAKDNSANFSISTSITTKLGAYNTAEENAMMGLDMVQTASSSLETISDKLSRMRALAVQAQNGTYGNDSIDAINSEANALAKEINRIISNTEYNGISLFKISAKVNTPTTQALDASQSTSPTDLVEKLKPNADGFIKDVQKRDTTNMISVSTLADDAKISSGTYKIETKEDLIKLSKIGSHYDNILGGEFVLANDIDMSGVDFEEITNFGSENSTATFDGNGYRISNLNNGLFETVYGDVKNLGLVNSNLNQEDNYLSPLAFVIYGNVSNCYSSGGSVGGSSYIFGCLVGGVMGNVDSSWSSTNVNGESGANGGLLGYASNEAHISNSFSTGTVINTERSEYNSDDRFFASGLVGIFAADEDHLASFSIENCYTTSAVYSESGGAGIIASNGLGGDYFPVTVKNVYYDSSANPNIPLFFGDASLITSSGLVDISSGNQTRLQIGVNSDTSSMLDINTYFNVGAIEGLDMSSANSLSIIDDALKRLNTKQVEFGSVQNRLESVLESIGVSIDNLTSTQSTIRDADIANLSSEYIRNQILQQAAATLLATANQTPAIALQLL